MKTKIINDTITTKRKKKFFQFALDIYTGKINRIFSGFDLAEYGFCNLYRYFFDENIYDFESLPELRKHKPKKFFYDYLGEETDDKSQFWFPPCQNEKRIKLCKKILKNL